MNVDTNKILFISVIVMLQLFSPFLLQIVVYNFVIVYSLILFVIYLVTFSLYHDVELIIIICDKYFGSSLYSYIM